MADAAGTKAKSGNRNKVLIAVVAIVAIVVAAIAVVIVFFHGFGGAGYPSASQLGAIFGTAFVSSGQVTIPINSSVMSSSGISALYVLGVTSQNYTSSTGNVSILEVRLNSRGVAYMANITKNAGNLLTQYDGGEYIVNPSATGGAPAATGINGQYVFAAFVSGGLQPTPADLVTLAQATIQAI